MRFHIKMLGLLAAAYISVAVLPWSYGAFALLLVAAAMGYVLGEARRDQETAEAWEACRKVREDRDEVSDALIRCRARQEETT